MCQRRQSAIWGVDGAYGQKNGITPPDVARLRHKDYKPAEYADIIPD